MTHCPVLLAQLLFDRVLRNACASKVVYMNVGKEPGPDALQHRYWWVRVGVEEFAWARTLW